MGLKAEEYLRKAEVAANAMAATTIQTAATIKSQPAKGLGRLRRTPTVKIRAPARPTTQVATASTGLSATTATMSTTSCAPTKHHKGTIHRNAQRASTLCPATL